MSLAAFLGRGSALESFGQRLNRSQRSEDGAYLLALVAGCLLGVGISWQAVLSEGARERLVAGMFGLADHAGAADLSAAPTPFRPAAEGMNATSGRPAEVSLIVSAPKPVVATAALPDRLVLDEHEVPTDRGRPAPIITTAIEFALNSSFLAPGDFAALRQFVSGLPDSGSVQVVLTATVSDDPIRNGGAAAAERYNRWLAERRADRVGAWLRGQVGDRAEIATEFLPHDPSRRVTVAVRPGP